jgi:predicted NAD/FAD-dependent oxidoreductase
MDAEVLIVGAGMAGLTCARDLQQAGVSVLVLEKSRGVGGRCATRRIENDLLDHGLAFYHGRDEELRASLERAGGDDLIPGWPRQIRGEGTPCQPRAFRATDWRLTYAAGVTLFPKHLATGLDVRLSSRVVGVESMADRWRVMDDGERAFEARDLVITIPTPQALALMDSRLDESRELRSLRSLLRDAGFVSTLTVMALYPPEVPVPAWEMWYPEESAILHLISHDSSKRRQPERTALVLQGLPAWSRAQWDRPVEEWRTAILDEAGHLAGSWAARPAVVQTHRWRYARLDSGGDLAGPALAALPGGRRLGFAGEGFMPGGGVEAAWRSGRELARRLMEGHAR